MFQDFQKTIKEPIQLEGVGLHNGIKVKLSLKPTEANSGIIFKRTDIADSENIIEASYKNVSSAEL
jgi:UDP-3-O-[3-hydroxymyristoyl] N-acetylglucosamine deacetylase